MAGNSPKHLSNSGYKELIMHWFIYMLNYQDRMILFSTAVMTSPWSTDAKHPGSNRVK